MPSKRLFALGLISVGLNAPSQGVALAAGAGLHMEMNSSRSIAGLTRAAAAATIHETKFIPPSGPREDCFTRCRSDVTACKKYAHATSGNDYVFLQNYLNTCDVTNRKCRATCEPLKNNPQ